MKTILMTLILAATMNTYATSVDMTPVLATVNGYEHGIKEIALLADARMQIVDKNGTVNTIKLGSIAFDRLAGSVNSLSNVELEEVNRTMVCKMMIFPTLSNLSISFYDYETRTYANNLTLVLTRQSCALAHEIFPKADYHYATANELREQLVILALNTLN